MGQPVHCCRKGESQSSPTGIPAVFVPTPFVTLGEPSNTLLLAYGFIYWLNAATAEPTSIFAWPTLSGSLNDMR